MTIKKDTFRIQAGQIDNGDALRERQFKRIIYRFGREYGTGRAAAVSRLSLGWLGSVSGGNLYAAMAIRSAHDNRDGYADYQVKKDRGEAPHG